MDSKGEDPKLPDDRRQSATAADNSDGGHTLAMKRARRVSFAENTSVHFFDRDEDTPPSFETLGNGDDYNSVSPVGFGSQPEQLKEVVTSEEDDGRNDDEDDEIGIPKGFLRPFGSPSPGGSTIGSASSIDEDNFFGPVSANFIRPGRWSDATSDDHHDVTMDSTAFSMHFRSLARSEPGTELKTQTGGPLLFEEKTPTNAHPGSSMPFTVNKRPTVKASLPVARVSGGDDSDDMSLVVDKPKKFDYAKLSPGLDALLAESMLNWPSDSVSDDNIALSSPRTLRKELVDRRGILGNGVVSATCSDLEETNGPPQTFLKGSSPQKLPSTTFEEASNIAVYRSNKSPPYQSSKEIHVVNGSCLAKQQQVVPTTASPPRQFIMTTPLPGQTGSLTVSKTRRDGDTSIQKSISKLDLLEKSPYPSAFSAKVDNSTIRSLDFLKSPDFGALLDTGNHASEETLSKVHHSEETIDALVMCDIGTEMPNHTTDKQHPEESFSRAMNVNQISRFMPRSNDNLPAGQLSAVSKSVCQNLDGPILQQPQRNMELPTPSPSGKEFDNQQVSSIKSPKSSGKLEKLSGSKRKLVLPEDSEHRTETTIMQRSPKQRKGGISGPDPQVYHNRGSGGAGNERTHWADIYSKFSKDTDQIVPRSAGALGINMIDVLEDSLIRRQKSKVYEMLCSGLQNTTVHNLQIESRKAETKSLLYQIIIEKAKLQLKHLKREKVLKRLQLLSSRNQEMQRLKTVIPSDMPKTNTTEPLVGHKSVTVNSDSEHQICHEKLSAMKEDLEAINSEVFNLESTLRTRFKIKDEPISDTIDLVREHLIKSADCRSIRQDMQMWVVQSISSENDQRNVVLNYLDFIVQRITVNFGPSPSASTSFNMNETSIQKKFPNIEVCKAFAFVFNTRMACKFVGPKTFALETQVTSSLLGALVDVAEEIKLALMEFRNLNHLSFSLPSAEQLDLVLCFFNFRTGRKVALTLNMSCLKRGVYPSDVVPVELTSHAGMKHDSLFREIRDMVKDVKTGHMRIFRLCKCVAQIVQSSC